MKQKFSIKWNASKQPRKQRKYFINAPLHIKRKLLSANLSEELRKKYNRRNIELRKKDEVQVMRGKSAKKQGKISAINKRKMKVAIEGIQKTRKDGTKVNLWFHASNLQITSLYCDDRKRLKQLQKSLGDNENASNQK